MPEGSAPWLEDPHGHSAPPPAPEVYAAPMGLAVGRRFEFDRDSFAFPNELVWEYDFDPATAAPSVRRRVPAPRYAHHCFVLVRAARQFLYHARFDPAAGRADDAGYRRLIREVLARSPRRPSEAAERIVIPGYAGLRELSAARESLVKEQCGGAWRSYFQRSHWRLVFPVSRAHQRRTARELLEATARDDAPLIHLLRFPSLTINHGMVIFEGTRTPTGILFLAYDPNAPEGPARLTYDDRTRAFHLPPNRYWRGGALNVFEIFRRWYR